jgi:predicted secreted hydrolase
MTHPNTHSFQTILWWTNQQASQLDPKQFSPQATNMSKSVQGRVIIKWNMEMVGRQITEN